MLQLINYLIGLILGLALIFYVYPKQKKKMFLYLGIFITLIWLVEIVRVLVS